MTFKIPLLTLSLTSISHNLSFLKSKKKKKKRLLEKKSSNIL